MSRIVIVILMYHRHKTTELKFNIILIDGHGIKLQTPEREEGASVRGVEIIFKQRMWAEVTSTPRRLHPTKAELDTKIITNFVHNKRAQATFPDILHKLITT
jgi:hypothetical protein